MKKSSNTIIIAVVLIAILGLVYIVNSYNLQKHNDGSSRIQDIQNGDGTKQVSEDITSGEYKFSISENDIVTAKFIKTGSVIKIYSLYPVENKSKYDISQSGNMAAYIGKDGHLWGLYNNGSKKRLTPDSFESVNKELIQKENPGYIWADKPVYTPEGNIRFISDLPDVSGTPKKSIWEVNIENNSMKKIFTPSSDNYKVLGYRDDGKLLILDGDTMAAIDISNNNVDNIDVKGKQVLNLSPNGKNIIYVKKDINNQPVFSNLFIMDSQGKNSLLLPHAEGYTATGIGSWDYNSSRYAYIIKSTDGSRDKFAVLNFDEDFIGINVYSQDTDKKFTDNSKIRWAEDYLISVDTGDDVISVEIK